MSKDKDETKANYVLPKNQTLLNSYFEDNNDKY